MNLKNINKSVMRNLGSSLMHLALMASPLSVSAATGAYYAGRRASYGKNNSYLIDEGLKGFRSSPLISDKKRNYNDELSASADLVTKGLRIKSNRAVRELVVVDSHVKNAKLFTKLARPGVEVITIPADSRGFDELMALLGKYEGLDAVHLFSHNHSGQLLLGNQVINAGVVQNNVEAFNVFNRSIDESGELVIYNCQLENHKHENDLVQLIQGNIDAQVTSASTDHAVFVDDLELTIKKGDPDTTPEEGSIALKELLMDFSFTGTIQFDEIKTAGNYAGDATNDAEFYTSAAKEYTLVADGTTGGTGAYYAPAVLEDGVLSYNGESNLRLNFSMGETSDVSASNSIYVFNYSGGTRTFSFTSNAGLMATTGAIASGSGAYVSLNSNNTGITYVDITADAGFYAHFSLFKVENTVAVANSTPVIGGAVSGQAVNDDSAILSFSSITVVDADGDNVSVTITLDDNAKGTLSGAGLTGTGPYTLTSASTSSIQSAIQALTFTPTPNRSATSETTTFTIEVNDGTDVASDNTTTVISNAVGPVITGVSIPNAGIKIGDVVTATVTVSSDTDDYTLGSGGIAGDVNGFALTSLSKISDDTYHALFTVTEGGSDIAAGSDIPLSITLTDSGGKASNTFTTPISQGADPIDANRPGVSSIALNGSPASGDTSVEFAVTFDEDVANVSPDDFAVTTVSGTATGAATGVVQNSGDTYTVTVSGINGSGTIRLDLNAGTDIGDVAGNDIQVGFTAGATHAVDVDTTDPVIVTKDITVQLDANGQATITPADVDNGSSDNSGTLNLTLDQSSFDCNTTNGGGTALNFDGTNDRVVIPDNAVLKPTNEVSVSAWVQTNNTSSVTQIFRAVALEFGNLYGYTLVAGNGGANYSFHVNINGVNSFLLAPIPDNGWHMLTGTWDGVNQRIYVDGVEITNQTTSAGTISYSPGATTLIGAAQQNSPLLQFDGSLDEIGTWSRALTPAEVQQLYGHSVNTLSTGLTGHWSFDDGTGSNTLSDLSGNGNNGTLTGMDNTTDWVASGANIFNSQVEVTLTGTDPSGNSASATAQVTLEDNIAPTLTLNGSAVVNLNLGDTYTESGATVSDNCISPLVNIGGDLVDTGTVGTYTVTYDASDASGNAASQLTRTVNVLDNTDPVITVNNISVNNDTGVCGAIIASYGASATDNSGSATLTFDIAEGSLFAVGTTTVTATATDGSGNSAQATFDITVSDVEVPVLSLNGSATVHLEIGDSYVESGASVSDNCSGASAVTTGGDVVSTAVVGSYVVTYDATDASGNAAAQITRTVNVADNTDPVITVNDISVNNDAGVCGAIIAAYGASATDNSGSTTLTFDIAEGSLFAVGTTAVTATATDGSGNSAQATFDVTITDTEAPVLSLNGSATVNLSAGDTYTELSAIVNDNCPGSSAVTIGGDVVNTNVVGTYIVTYDATDASGNAAAQITRTVNVADNTDPVITVSDISVNNDAGVCGATILSYGASATDESGIASFSFSIAEGSLFNVGTTQVTATATDNSGNTATANFNVTVVDAEDPVAIAQNFTVALDATGNASITAADINNNSTDNCGITNLSLDRTDFSCADLGGQNLSALDFDPGAADGFRTDNNVNIPIGNSARTFSAWVNLDAIPSSWGGIMHQGNGDCTGKMFGIGVINGHYAVWGGCRDWVSGFPASTGTWTHIAVTYDGAGNLTLYRNGQGQGTNIGSYVTTASRLFLGLETTNNGASYRNSIDGKLDEVKVFDRALTAAEVLDEMNGNAPAEANLVAYYPLDEGSGNFVEDVVGGNNGTALGTADWITNTAPVSGASAGTEVTLTVTDANGNSSSATATVTVVDNIAPSIALVGNATVNLNLGDTYVEDGATVTENCTAPLVIGGDVVDTNVLGTYTITYDATDQSGNMATQVTRTVNVLDNVDPVITVNDIVVGNDPGNCSALIAAYGASATDNAGNVSLTFDIAEGSVFPVGTSTVTATATDDAGNTATATFNVTVNDTEAPVLLLNGSSVINLNQGDTYTELGATVSDNCPGAAVVVGGDVVNTGIAGTYTVLYNATDAAGNAAVEIERTVNVIDNVAPVITANDITAFTRDDRCSAVINNYGVTATDPSGIADLSFNFVQGTVFPKGTTQVTATATDNAGNVGTATFNVTVIDNVAPFVQGHDITLALDANGQATLPVPAAPQLLFSDDFESDASGLELTALTNWNVTQGNVDVFAGAQFGLPITNNALELAGNVNGAIETKNTILFEPGNYRLRIDYRGMTGEASIGIDIGSLLGASITEFTNEFFEPAEFDFTVTQTTSATIRFNEFGGGSGVFGTLIDNVRVYRQPDGIIASVYDNCVVTDISASQTDFTCADLGFNTVTITVADEAGNQRSTDIQVQIVDNLVPVLTGQNTSVTLGAGGTASITPQDVTLSSADNCGPVTLSLSRDTFDANDALNSPLTIDLTATDPSGNSTTVQVEVEVIDPIPVAICQDIFADLGPDGTVTIDPSQVDGGSTSVVGIASLSLDRDTFTCADIGPQTVTLTVTSTLGSTATCQATVTVRDVSDPVVAVQNINLDLDASGNAALTAADLVTSADDNCAIASTTIDVSSFNCDNVGPNTVTVTVTDASGNSTQAQATVMVRDVTAPTVNVQSISVSLDEAGNATISTDDINLGSDDACGVESVSLDRTAFGCDDIGVNTVTLTVTDVNGNSASADATVTVSDVTAPVLDVQDITLQLDANGQASLPALTGQTTIFFDDFSADVPALAKTDLTHWNVTSGDVDIFFPNQFGLPFSSNALDLAGDVNGAIESKQSFQFDPGTYRLTFTVLGNNGDARLGLDIGTLLGTSFTNFIGGTIETRSVDFTVTTSTSATIRFNEFGDAPFFSGTTIDNIELSRLGEGLVVFADDACGISSITASETSFDCTDIGSSIITVTATDVNGNETEAQAQVTVEDNIAPDVVPQNIEVALGANGQVSISAAQVDGGTTDNCDFDLSIDVSTFNCNNLGANTVTLTATDGSGNSASAQAIVTVVDNAGPSIGNLTVEVQLDENGEGSITVADVAAAVDDNCGVNTISVDITGFTCENLGANTVTITATDVNGNTNTGTITVNVLDIIPPVVTTQNVSLELDENGQAVVTAEDVLILSEEEIDTGEECTVSAAEHHAVWLSQYVKKSGKKDDDDDDGYRGKRKRGRGWGWGRGDDDDDNHRSRAENTRFVFDANGGSLSRNADGTATVTGTIQSTSKASDQWVVTLNLRDARSWQEWSALGRSYKDERGIAGQRFRDWTYYEMADGSKLTGAGINAGEEISLSHAPSDYRFGFQLGDAANGKNGNYGLSGWFFYTNRKGHKVQGDFNLDVTDCTPNGPSGTVVTSDNCSIETITLSQSSFDCTDIGENTIQVTVTDQSGNATTETATVTISDNIAPVAVAQDITVSLGADGTVTIDPSQVDGGSTDNTNCGLTFSLSQGTFDCSDIGKYKGRGHHYGKGKGHNYDDDNDPGNGKAYGHKKGRGQKVTLTVTDAAGNSDSATAYVTVVDDMGPTISEDPITIVVYDRRREYLYRQDVYSRVDDNCRVRSIWFPRSRFDKHDAGMNQVQVRASDYSGNVTYGHVNVNVIDISSYGRYVDICYRGQTRRVKKYHVQKWIRKGATLGSCGTDLAMNTGGVNLNDALEREVTAEPLIELGAFPNPSQGETVIKFSSELAGPAQVGVINPGGIRINSLFDGEIAANENVEIRYNTRDLPSGVYIIRLVTAGEVRSLKLMVKK